MKQQIKNELLEELGVVDEIEFDKAYYNAKGSNKYEVKKAVKSVLIQLLEKNATNEHKTKAGKVGAFLSNVFAKILPFINLNSNKK